jgi:glutamate racemase
MPQLGELDTVSSVTRWPLRDHALTLAFVGVLGTHSVAGKHLDSKLVDQLSEDSKTSQLPSRRFVAFTETAVTEQGRRNMELASLIRSWLDDASGYDEEVGPELDRILRENPFQLRE